MGRMKDLALELTEAGIDYESLTHAEFLEIVERKLNEEHERKGS